jgi:hypothetical protein
MTFVFTNPEEVSVEKVWKPVFEKTGQSPQPFTIIDSSD